jgi:hypothetical protein
MWKMLEVSFVQNQSIQYLPLVVLAGLWIRIDSIRIRIQHFSSIRIHIVSVSGSNLDPQPWLLRIRNRRCAGKLLVELLLNHSACLLDPLLLDTGT